MGHMKDLDRRIRQGGDDAIAAACELAGIAKERLRLSANGDCPKPDNGAKQDILTVAEREAVEWCVEMALNSATDCVAEINTLRFLLERL